LLLLKLRVLILLLLLRLLELLLGLLLGVVGVLLLGSSGLGEGFALLLLGLLLVGVALFLKQGTVSTTTLWG
jgi:hypothetical protein